jgi:predicted secreted protein
MGVLVLCTACASAPVPKGSSASTSTSSNTLPDDGGTSTTTSSTANGEVAIDEAANGTTVHLAVGQVLALHLHSTYWAGVASSDTASLDRISNVVTPQPANSSCPPGGGCGSVTARFMARAPGTASVSATRQLCGEAFQCPPAQRSFEVQVSVGQ